MDFIRILQFEEWRKNNDNTNSGLNRFNMAGLNERLAVEVAKVTHDEGLFNQRIIGGKAKTPIRKIGSRHSSVTIVGF